MTQALALAARTSYASPSVISRGFMDVIRSARTAPAGDRVLLRRPEGHSPRQPRPASRSSESTRASGISIGTGVARTVRAAQMLIERGVRLDADLAGLDVDLRRLAGARNVAGNSALCAGGRMTVARVSARVCKRFRTAPLGLLTSQQVYDSINF